MPCNSMYQMLKLKLGPQDIRGTEGKEQRQVRSRAEAFIVQFVEGESGQSPTYFNKSAGEHLLVNLVL